jgi:DNA invertase Pin-like site-specific DNA recombinase
MPDANRLTIGIMAMIAEHEADAISARTKAALAAAKRRGVKLGNPEHLNAKARRKGTAASARVRGMLAAQRAVDLAPIVAELRHGGATSLRMLAAGLNAKGIATARGFTWSAPQVQRLLARLEESGG